MNLPRSGLGDCALGYALLHLFHQLAVTGLAVNPVEVGMFAQENNLNFAFVECGLQKTNRIVIPPDGRVGDSQIIGKTVAIAE